MPLTLTDQLKMAGVHVCVHLNAFTSGQNYRKATFPVASGVGKGWLLRLASDQHPSLFGRYLRLKDAVFGCFS